MYPLLTTCPVCGGPLHVERLGCDECHAAIEGRFTLGWLGRLSREQLDFVEYRAQPPGRHRRGARLHRATRQRPPRPPSHT